MKAAFTFRAVAVDETSNWNLPPVLYGATVFGIYMIAEGEATHICSFTPSSGAEFLRNDFNVTDCADPAAAQEYLSNGEGQGMEMENGGESFTYLSYQDCTSPARQPYLSEPLKLTMDSETDTFDRDAYQSIMREPRYDESVQKTRARAGREGLRQAAWDSALEEMNANWRGCPVTDGDAFLAHKGRTTRRAAEVAERYGSTAPLLTVMGVAAPLDIRV